MEHVLVPGTQTHPAIDFNFLTGDLRISGRSTHSDPGFFFRPLLDHLDTYINGKRPLTTLTVDLEYINTPSSKYVLDVFKKMRLLRENGNELLVKWLYDDEDVEEMGQDYSDATGIPFELVEKKQGE